MSEHNCFHTPITPRLLSRSFLPLSNHVLPSCAYAILCMEFGLILILKIRSLHDCSLLPFRTHITPSAFTLAFTITSNRLGDRTWSAASVLAGLTLTSLLPFLLSSFDLLARPLTFLYFYSMFHLCRAFVYWSASRTHCLSIGELASPIVRTVTSLIIARMKTVNVS